MAGLAAIGISLATLLVLVSFPITDASHCSSGISVYHRTANLPGIVPPPAPTGRVCLAMLKSSSMPAHTLGPGADQITVRVDTDVGQTYPTLMVRLAGLGWTNQIYLLQREASITGTTFYNLGDWLTIPDPRAEDPTLHVSVRFPGDVEGRAEYVLVRAPVVQTP